MVVTVDVMCVAVQTGTTLQLSDDKGTVRRLESENWIDSENKIVFSTVVMC